MKGAKNILTFTQAPRLVGAQTGRTMDEMMRRGE